MWGLAGLNESIYLVLGPVGIAQVIGIDRSSLSDERDCATRHATFFLDPLSRLLVLVATLPALMPLLIFIQVAIQSAKVGSFHVNPTFQPTP